MYMAVYHVRRGNDLLVFGLNLFSVLKAVHGIIYDLGNLSIPGLDLKATKRGPL